MGEGFLQKIRDAKSGNARKEVLEEVNRLTKEKRESERKNTGTEEQLNKANRLIAEKDTELSGLRARLELKDKIISEKGAMIDDLKARLDAQNKKIDENRSTVRTVRKDNAKLQKAFHTMKKIAFLPRKEEED